MKVLVACPQSDKKRYAFKAWSENVMGFTYPDYDVFMADNSENNNFQKHINNLSFTDFHGYQKKIVCDYIKPYGKTLMQRISESHEACRIRAIEGNYDYLLHLESDVIPPRTIIEDLISCNKQVVGGLYHIGLGENSHLLVVQAEEYGDNARETWLMGKDLITFLDGTVKNVFHAGLGCVLIRKDVLPKFKFRYLTDVAHHHDSFFGEDMLAERIPVYVDTSIICEHLNQPQELFQLNS